MIEGLWTGEWQSNVSHIANHAAGTFVLEAGKIYGGDTRYYYIGSYAMDGDNIVGGMDFFHFSGDPIGILGCFKQGHLSFKGEWSPTTIKITANIKEDGPVVRIAGVWTKRVNLQ